MTLDEFLAEWNNSDPHILVHTSGSTGTPKPMWVEKQKMLNSARITCDFLHLNSGDNALLCMPLDYIAGKMMVVRSLQRGMNIVSVPPSNHPLASLVDNADIPSLLHDDYLIHLAAMVPSQVFCSLQIPEERRLLKRIRHLIIGGGAITSALAHELTTLFSAEECKDHFIWSTYGMTETLSHIALRRLNGEQASDWYTPFDHVDISLNADDCLCINAPMVHDGLLQTNDIAEIKDGKFRIVGRKDNVICSGGIKLQIEEIEETLRTLLAPLSQSENVEFCISKCSDMKFGEVAVLLLNKVTNITDDALQSAFSKLDRYSVPKRVVRVDSIPLTETGKIDRKASQELAMFH